MALSGCGVGAEPAPSGLFDCGTNTPGTGDLATDVIGKWQFFENSSPQHFTFIRSGSAVRTWTTPETGEILYTAHAFNINGDTVSISDYGDFAFDVDETGVWRVFDGSQDVGWTRCERSGGSAQ